MIDRQREIQKDKDVQEYLTETERSRDRKIFKQRLSEKYKDTAKKDTDLKRDRETETKI